MEILSPFDPQIAYLGDNLERYHHVWLPDGKLLTTLPTQHFKVFFLQCIFTFLLHSIR